MFVSMQPVGLLCTAFTTACCVFQRHRPGAVRATPLPGCRGAAAVSGLQEHAAGAGGSLGPAGLAPGGPGGAAAAGHQQHLVGPRCCSGDQTQVGAASQQRLLKHVWYEHA